MKYRILAGTGVAISLLVSPAMADAAEDAAAAA